MRDVSPAERRTMDCERCRHYDVDEWQCRLDACSFASCDDYPLRFRSASAVRAHPVRVLLSLMSKSIPDDRIAAALDTALGELELDRGE